MQPAKHIGCLITSDETLQPDQEAHPAPYQLQHVCIGDPVVTTPNMLQCSDILCCSNGLP